MQKPVLLKKRRIDHTKGLVKTASLALNSPRQGTGTMRKCKRQAPSQTLEGGGVPCRHTLISDFRSSDGLNTELLF